MSRNSFLTCILNVHDTTQVKDENVDSSDEEDRVVQLRITNIEDSEANGYNRDTLGPSKKLGSHRHDQATLKPT